MIEQTLSETHLPSSRSQPAFRPDPISAAGNPRRSERPSVHTLRGLDAVLAAQPRLVELARDSGQTGEADSLAFLLSTLLATPDIIPKTPYLLLIHGLEPPAARRHVPPVAGGLSAAVLLFQYDTPLGGSGFFVGYDPTGRRTVIAPRELRARAAALATRFLLAQGAHFVRIALSEAHDDSELLRDPVTGEASDAGILNQGTALHAVAAEFRGASPSLPAPRGALQWAVRETHAPAYLPLLPTMQATLSRIGQKTRFNLRYYRRRAEKLLGASFVPDVQITLPEFLAFNHECGFGVSTAFATHRYRLMTTQPNCCVRGVRDRNGRWLAMAGLRRQNGFVELDWQLNRSDLPAASLCTVFRSFLIEHEIGLGSTRLYIEGGTGHALQFSFLRQRVTDVVARRNSLRVRLVQCLAATLLSPRSYVRDTLLATDFDWRSC